MKKTKIATLIIGAAASIFAHADEALAPPSSVYAEHPHRLYFGLPEFLWLHCDTHIFTTRVEKNSLFGGLKFGYEYLKPNAFYAGIDILSTATLSNFKVHRNGEDISHDGGASGFGNSDIRFGYTLSSGKWMITPFAGIGAYVLMDERKHGFWERSPYYSLGLRTKYIVSRTFDPGLNFKTFRTRNFLNKHFRNHRFNMASSRAGWGTEIGVPLTWHMGKTQRWEIQLEPYFTKILYGETQNIFGANLLFGYHF